MVRAICGVQQKRQKNIYRFDVHAGFEGNCRSIGYGKQCSLVWSCVEERGWSHLKKGIIFRGRRSKEQREAEEDVGKQVEEESVKVGLRRIDALCQSKWSVVVNRIAAGLR